MSALQVMAYTATGIDETLLDKPQNDLLANALANVAKHYPPIMSRKQQDIMALVGAALSIGSAQASKYRTRRANEKAERARNVTGTGQ